MENGPKSFWGEVEELNPNLRVSHLDGTWRRPIADILFVIHRAGITKPEAERYKLWELAAACGLHLGETIAEKDQRDIIDTKQAEWAETKDRRTELLREAAERRRERKGKGKAKPVADVMVR